ncbi:glycosyltransferase [Maribacter ulvicola]|uniref:Glycosyltransferase involved in cell wall bisynthesis n=1 Tax=Maribacter ulvicola TaxID=228959 RepID=A0A1N6QTR6_9FLAO|nr:glycosyltransferase [Maribacter ulvicola]SIQ19902.1 Glycosyltransferase involved in cell wall bisynthesis [Maribacter ulvicola]
MNTDFELAIVIPCYNEAKRLKIERYKSFLNSYNKVLLCFVNDGSRDNTIEVIEQLKTNYPLQVHLMSLEENKGKAEAVRTGVLECLKGFYFKNIAYLDADLSTSLEECVSISEQVNVTTSFAFGSRISKLDTTIDRKRYRFFIGRCIATLISRQLDLKVYDTQCGCKVFKRGLASSVFQEEFVSTWLFDVELFHRLIAMYGKNQLKYIAKEIPLQSWYDTEDSRVPLSFFFKLWYDLYKIGKDYKTPIKFLKPINERVFE